MDINMIMKQARKMQSDLEKAQKELDATLYEGNSNGLKVVINGKNEVQSIEIPDDMMDDKDMLQDILVVALNQAVENASADREKRLGSATNGMKLPGM